MVILGEPDINPYSISKKAGVSEQEFYQFFSSADEVGRKIWARFLDTTMLELSQSDKFNNEYSAREKILTYFFTFINVAREDRTFIIRTCDSEPLLRTYSDMYKDRMSDIVQEGISMEDIKERIYSGYYSDMLWGLHLMIIKFWAQDDSDKFVETEKAIEIYSKVPLEVMGHNIFDSMYESMKFAVQSINFNWFSSK